MSSENTAGSLQPVGPSPFVRLVMGPMTRMLNPPIRKLAGRTHFGMAAQLRHIGRRSGRAYVTPVGARLTGDTVVIPLTFGNKSDWARNVRAAGGCSIRIRGKDYVATAPEFVSPVQAREVVRSAFGAMERASFGMLGIRQVLIMRVTPRPAEPDEQLLQR